MIVFRILLLVLFTVTTAVAEEYLVNPEIITTVKLSSTDVNRVSCENGQISDVFYSTEKGIEVKQSGSNAFIKFQIRMVSGKESHVKKPSEFHIICDGNVYTIIGKPRRGAPTTIRLNNDSRKRLDENMAIFQGMTREDAIVKATLSVLKQENLDSVRVKKEQQKIDSFNEVVAEKKNTYMFDGVGLWVSEYIVTPQQDLPTMNERAFIDTRFGKNIYAITLIPQPLKKHKKARLLVVHGSGTYE